MNGAAFEAWWKEYTCGQRFDLDKLVAEAAWQEALKRHDGPKTPAVEALKHVLDEIEEYLKQRQDIKDGSDGVPQANTEMNLLTDLIWWRDAAGLYSTPATGMPSKEEA